VAGDGDSAGEGLAPPPAPPPAPPAPPPPSQAPKKLPNTSAKAKPTTFLFITPLSPIAVTMNEPLVDHDTAFVDFFHISLINAARFYGLYTV
jgi:hypothetical protein